MIKYKVCNWTQRVTITTISEPWWRITWFCQWDGDQKNFKTPPSHIMGKRKNHMALPAGTKTDKGFPPKIWPKLQIQRFLFSFVFSCCCTFWTARDPQLVQVWIALLSSHHTCQLLIIIKEIFLIFFSVICT
jgi:hypothetical protein